MKRILSKRARRAVAAVARRGHSHEGERCQDCESFRRLLRAALLPHGAVSGGGAHRWAPPPRSRCYRRRAPPMMLAVFVFARSIFASLPLRRHRRATLLF